MQFHPSIRPVVIVIVSTLAIIIFIYLDAVLHPGAAPTGLTLLTSCSVIAAAAVLHHRFEQREQQRQERLRKRAEAHRLADWYATENGKVSGRLGERGELSPVFLVVLLVLVFVWLCLAYVPHSRAEGGDLGRMLIEETARQWPRVPLNSQELSELQDLNLRLRVLAEGLTDSPADAGTGIREKRLFLKRKLESASESIVDALVSHATALVRRGGGL